MAIRLRVKDPRQQLAVVQPPRQTLRVAQPQPMRINQVIGPQNSRSLALEQNRLWRAGQITPQQYKSRIGAIYAGENVQHAQQILQPTTNRRGIGQFTQPALGSVARGFGGALSNLTTFAGSALEAGGINNPLDQWARGQQQGINEFLRASQFDPAPRPGENRFVVNLGSGAGSLATSLLLRNPNAAGAMFGVQAGAEQVRQARDAGQSAGRALLTGTGAGVVEGSLERVGLDRLLKVGGGPVRSFIRGALIEGIQEASQSLGQSVISDTYRDVDYSDAVIEALIEGGYGAILGGGVGMGVSGFNRLTQDPALRQDIKRKVAEKIRSTTPQAVSSRQLGNQIAIKQTTDKLRIAQRNNDQRAVKILNKQLRRQRVEGIKLRALESANMIGLSTKKVDGDPLEALKAEARKYRSADEFVKAQEKNAQRVSVNLEQGNMVNPDDYALVYHGTSEKNLSSIEKEGFRLGEKPLNQGRADAISVNLDSNVGTYSQGGGVVKARVRIKNLIPDPERQGQYFVKNPNDIEIIAIGRYGGNLDPTYQYKSQLTDIWNKATQPTPPAESGRQSPESTTISEPQSRIAPQNRIKIQPSQDQRLLSEPRSLSLLPTGTIQLSPSEAKIRFRAMDRRGQSYEVLNKIRDGSKPIYVTPGGKVRVGRDFTISVKHRGGEKIIKVDRNPVDVSIEPNNLKDISGFEAYMKDFNRIMEKVFTAGSSQFKQVDAEIIKPLENAKGDYITFQQEQLADLKKAVVDGLGIKKGSPESAAVQLFGEGQLSADALVQQFGEQRANDIREADQYFRAKYDQLIDQVNAQRRRIYGNNPDKLVQKRKDYYRHFRELNQGFAALKNIFSQVADIPPELAGTSEFTSPKSKFLSFAQRRLGIQTDIDAVGGYLNYLPAASYAMHIDPQIDRLRTFKQNLVSELTGRREQVDSLRSQIGEAIQNKNWDKYDELKTQLDGITENGKYDDTVVNNFLGFLDDYTNDLAGKTNPADRFPQKVIGRKAFQAIDWMNKRVKANVILGNASSSIAQFFNMPQGIAQAGPQNAYKGAVRSFKTIGNPDAAMRKSKFLSERYFDGYNQFDTKVFDKVRNFSAWMVQVGDEVGTKFIWNSMYEQALEQNMNESQAIRFADNQTQKMVAGRGVGEVPLLQKSRVFQMVAPFQLEVQNLWYVLGDQVSKKEFGKLVTFAVSVHLMNSAAEAIRGSDVAFDPIEALLEAFSAFDDEDDKKVGALLAAGRLGGEVLSNVPLGQQLASIYPEYGVNIGDETVTRKELFGDADPTRFGTGFGGGTLIGRGIQDPLFRLIPPLGGQQIKRSLEATQTLNRGYSETPSGRVRFPVDDNLRNRVQGTVFGQHALPEAREYFDEGRSALGEKQSERIRLLPRDQRQAAYDEIIANRQLSDEEKKAVREIEKQDEIETRRTIARDNSQELFSKYGLPPTTLTDEVADAYGRLLERVARGEMTDVSLPSRERYIVKDAYLSQLDPRVREFWSLGDDDMRRGLINGVISQAEMDDLIKLDDMLVGAGLLKYPQVGKRLRAELGYGGGSAGSPSGRRPGGRGRSIKLSSLKPSGAVTTANDILIAFNKVKPKSTNARVPGDPNRIIRIARA